jgi:hypothetical protein
MYKWLMQRSANAFTVNMTSFYRKSFDTDANLVRHLFPVSHPASLLLHIGWAFVQEESATVALTRCQNPFASLLVSAGRIRLEPPTGAIQYGISREIRHITGQQIPGGLTGHVRCTSVRGWHSG